MTNDVAIIGVGLHPFGRFEKTAQSRTWKPIQQVRIECGCCVAVAIGLVDGGVRS